MGSAGKKETKQGVGRVELAAGGPEISRLAMGAWRIADGAGMSRDELRWWIEACLAEGITTFDHADIYGMYGEETCEELFGAVLGATPGLRERLELVSKCDIRLPSSRGPEIRVKHYDTSRRHIVAAVERSLTNLRTDWLDVLLLHRPDPLMDADEVAAAFDELRRAGKVRHFGASNFTPSQFELLSSRLDTPLVTNQVEFSLLHLEPLHDGTFDQCQRLGIVPMAWSPLAGGRIFHDESERGQRLRAALSAVGEELGGAAADQVALAFLRRPPVGVVPVLGTGHHGRIRGAAAAVDIELDRQQWFTLWSASTGMAVP